MRASDFLGPLLFAAASLAQAVPEGIAPSSAPPNGCQTTVSGSFQIGTLENFSSSSQKRAISEAALDGAVTCTLNGGILHDQYNRTGSIVANQQFQFDGPPQAGAIYTGGFSVCKNDSLALGGSARWWRCMSGNFGNLYDTWIGSQCHEIRIQAIFPDQASSSAANSVSMVAKSDFPTTTLAVSATASATASAAAEASKTGHASGSTGATASMASSTAKAASSSPSTVAVAPPAKGNDASAHNAHGVFLAAMVILGVALIV